MADPLNAGFIDPAREYAYPPFFGANLVHNSVHVKAQSGLYMIEHGGTGKADDDYYTKRGIGSVLFENSRGEDCRPRL